MITKVEALSGSGLVLSLSLTNPDNGYILQSIDNLDPVDATVVSSSYATMDGEQFQSSKRAKRNPVLTVGLAPDWVTSSVQALRANLYNFFMPKMNVTLRFYDSNGTYVSIDGVVEKFTAPLFTQSPTATISILCMNPDFYDSVTNEIDQNTVSSISDFVATYLGSVSTGVTMRFVIDRDVNEFVITQTALGVIRSMDVQYDFNAGDILTISTTPGSKSITLTRGGIDTPILYAVSPTSVWLELEPGANSIRVYASGDPILYTIKYTNKYGGL